MKQPGPDHPIAIVPSARRVRVVFNGRVVAESGSALVMRERNYDPVFYIPCEDADSSLFERTDHSTYCPYKGDASYFSIRADGRISENAIWTYEQPYSAVAEIKDRLAFYSNRVDSIEELDDKSAGPAWRQSNRAVFMTVSASAGTCRSRTYRQ